MSNWNKFETQSALLCFDGVVECGEASIAVLKNRFGEGLMLREWEPLKLQRP